MDTAPDSQLIDKAIDALDAEHPKEALLILERVLAATPGSSDAIVLKSQALVQLDRWEEAEEWLEKSAFDHADDPQILLALADLVLDLHSDDEDAVEQACIMAERSASLVQGWGNHELEVEALRTIGRAEMALNEPAAAAAALRGALNLSPESDELRLDLARAWFLLGRFDDTREILAALREADTEDAEVHFYLGLLDERAGDFAAAETAFQRAHALDPEDFPGPFRLSDEDFARAVEDARTRLPERVQRYLKGVPVTVEPLPPDEEVGPETLLTPLTGAVLLGDPAADDVDPWTQPPTGICVFQRNVERDAGSREDIVETIAEMLLDEVGAFTGEGGDEESD